MRKLIPLILFSSLSAFWAEEADYWQPYAQFEGQVGNYRKGGGVVAWVPMTQDGTSIFFAQGSVGFYRRNLFGASLGVGYRRMFSDNIAWGVNAFGDWTRSIDVHSYAQGGIGGELFGRCWSARINGYIASKDREVLDRRFRADVFTQGLNLFSNDQTWLFQESSYSGFDIELGYGFDLFCGQLWSYATYFYFDAKRVQEIQGPRLRLEYRVNLMPGFEASLGGEYEWNRLHGHTGQAIGSLRVPFEFFNNPTFCQGPRSCCNSICKQMGDPVRRERTIWIDRDTWKHSRVIDLGQQLIFVQGGETAASGTQADPTDLEDAISIGSPGDVFFGLNTNGDIDVNQTGVGGNWTLLDGQSLYSFGNAAGATPTSLSSVPVTVPGGRTLIVNDLTGTGRATLAATGVSLSLLTIADGNTVSGMGFDAGVVQIGSTGATNFLIRNNLLENVPGTTPFGMINIIGTDGRIVANEIRDPAGTMAIHILLTQTGPGDVTIEENVISQAMGVSAQGIFVSPGGGETRILNNTVTGTYTTGTLAAGISIGVNDGNTGSTFIDGNMMSVVSTRGIHVTEQFGGTIVTMPISITGNGITVTGGDGVGVDVGLSVATSSYLVDISLDGNTVTSDANALAITQDLSTVADEVRINGNNNTFSSSTTTVSTTGTATGFGVAKLTLTDNNGVGSPTDGYIVTHDAGFTGFTCLTMTGNDSNTAGMGIGLVNPTPAGIIQVTNLGTLSIDNNGLTVTSSGPPGVVPK